MYSIWPSGNVEIFTNIRYDDRLVLEGFLESISVSFLELVYTNGDSTATVRTIKPLDAEKLKEVCFTIFFVRSSK